MLLTAPLLAAAVQFLALMAIDHFTLRAVQPQLWRGRSSSRRGEHRSDAGDSAALEAGHRARSRCDVGAAPQPSPWRNAMSIPLQ